MQTAGRVRSRWTWTWTWTVAMAAIGGGCAPSDTDASPSADEHLVFELGRGEPLAEVLGADPTTGAPQVDVPKPDPEADPSHIPDIIHGTRLLLQFRPVKSEERYWSPYLHYFSEILVPREQGQTAGIKPRTALAREWRDEIQEAKGRSKGRKGAQWKR